MSDGRDGELAELERRAYGPHADIRTDPEAMLRLIRLQEQRRALRSTVTPAAPEPSAGGAGPLSESALRDAGRDDAGRDDASDDASDDADDSNDADDSAGNAATAEVTGGDGGGRGRRRSLRVTAAVVALAAVAGASSAATWAIARFDPRQVAVLSPDPEAPGPEDVAELFGPLVRYDDLFGIEVSAGSRDRDGVAESCLVISETDEYSVGTCSSIELGVTTIVPITDSSPEAARARFPEGTLLELTYRGGDITVRASA